MGGSGDRLTEVASPPLGTYAPWLGVAVFGVGVAWTTAPGPHPMGWIILCSPVRLRRTGDRRPVLRRRPLSVPEPWSWTPVAMFAAAPRNRGHPRRLLCPRSGWLIPGALGLVGVAKYLGDERIDGAASLVTAGVTIVAIALGVLLGLARRTTSRGAVHRGRRETGPDPDQRRASSPWAMCSSLRVRVSGPAEGDESQGKPRSLDEQAGRAWREPANDREGVSDAWLL